MRRLRDGFDADDAVFVEIGDICFAVGAMRDEAPRVLDAARVARNNHREACPPHGRSRMRFTVVNWDGFRI